MCAHTHNTHTHTHTHPTWLQANLLPQLPHHTSQMPETESRIQCDGDSKETGRNPSLGLSAGAMRRWGCPAAANFLATAFSCSTFNPQPGQEQPRASLGRWIRAGRCPTLSSHRSRGWWGTDPQSRATLTSMGIVLADTKDRGWAACFPATFRPPDR